MEIKSKKSTICGNLKEPCKHQLVVSYFDWKEKWGVGSYTKLASNSNSTIGNIMCSVQRLRLVSKLISRRKRKSKEFAVYNLCQLYIWLI